MAWPEPDPASPFFLVGPALISFSGGRTSAFMLFQILWAHGGALPADVHACFANTGKELEETLRFVFECGIRWNVRIRWVEYKRKPPGRRRSRACWRASYDEVGYNSASRKGEPFEALIQEKQILPNPTKRLCTEKLKIDTMKSFMKGQGYKHWINPVGLRRDEVRRIVKQDARNNSGKECFTATWPLFKAEITKADIWRFWLAGNADPKNLTEPLPMGFDLGLYPYEGNCDGCFLKGAKILTWQERERPGYLDWWIAQEAAKAGKTRKPEMSQFNAKHSCASLKAEVHRSPLLVPLDWRNLEFDAECGVSGTDTSIRCGARVAA